jgi:glycosyltransferase involved in cell wall biosynthesis
MKLCLFNVTSTIAPIGSTEIGGVEIYTFRLAEALMRRGHDVVLFGGEPKKPFSTPSPSIPRKLFQFVETQNIPDLGTRFQRLLQRIRFAYTSRNEFLKESFDAIFIFKPYDFGTAWLWRKWGVKSKIIASLHGTEFFLGDRFFSKAIDSMYAVSDETAQKMSDRYRRSCDVIPNFLNEHSFEGWQRPKPPEEKIILSVGRFVEMKGMMNLLEAFREIRKKKENIKLILLGDGPEKSRFETWIREHHLENSISLPGIQTEEKILDYLRKCWVYVQPSIGEESFSISTLEAFALGLNVIASDRVYVARLFQKLSAVEIYPAQDVKELQRLLRKTLTENWEEVQMKGARSRKIVEENFFSSAVLPKIEQICSARS